MYCQRSTTETIKGIKSMLDNNKSDMIQFNMSENIKEVGHFAP